MFVADAWVGGDRELQINSILDGFVIRLRNST